jgi:hypothetical protein
VTPSSETFQAAAANADRASKPGYGVILANQPGATSWPTTAATWILLNEKSQDPAATAQALKFFAWSYAKGDKMADELDYVPMPDEVVADLEKSPPRSRMMRQAVVRCQQIARLRARRGAARRLFPIGRRCGTVDACGRRAGLTGGDGQRSSATGIG